MLDVHFLEELTLKTQRLIDDFGIPGAALGVVFGNVAWTSCFGFTELEKRLTVTENTLFQVGSVTKTVTATVIMHLVERGQLDLDILVADYVKELVLGPNVLKTLTVRHLLLHLGGWKSDNNFDNNDTGTGDNALLHYIQKMKDLPRFALPGEAWCYSNAGFRLLGRIIESVTSMSYEEAVNNIVLKPLNLTDSLFFPSDIYNHAFAFGHNETSQGLRRLQREFLPRNAAAVGGLCSTLSNLMTYARFQLGFLPEQVYKTVISQPTLKEMQTPTLIETRAVMPGFDVGKMGLGWFVFDIQGLRFIAHGGMTGGFLTSFWLVPDFDFAFIFLTNSRSKNAHSQLTALMRQHLTQIDLHK